MYGKDACVNELVSEASNNAHALPGSSRRDNAPVSLNEAAVSVRGGFRAERAAGVGVSRKVAARGAGILDGANPTPAEFAIAIRRARITHRAQYLVITRHFPALG